MDLSYSQQQHARRKNRSSANLQHLSLAPLTTRLPLRDDFDGSDIIDSHGYFASAARSHGGPLARAPSYIQGRSAPTTPRLLSKSPPPLTPSQSQSREGSRGPRMGGRGSNGGLTALPKSRSTTHLLAASYNDRHSVAGIDAVAAGSSATRHHRRRKTDHRDDYSSGDWLFRAGVLMTSEARESKGQSWLAARASSTSLSGLRDAEEAADAAAFERELARERDLLERVSSNSRRASRRGSVEHFDLTSPTSFSRLTTSRSGSRLGSRATSRNQSRVGSRVQIFTPLERRSLDHSGPGGEPLSAGASGYFDHAGFAEDDEYEGNPVTPAGPDFVNLDEKLEAIEIHQRDTSLEDEDQVRRLVKREKAGGAMGSWLGNVFGWSLFSVQETDGEGGSETEDYAEDGGDEGGEDDDFDEDEDDDDIGSEEGELDDKADNAAGAEGAATNERRRSRKKRRVAVGWNQRGPAWSSRRRLEGDSAIAEDRMPPPPRADEGTWQDAAWLLSVASKVIL